MHLISVMLKSSRVLLGVIKKLVLLNKIEKISDRLEYSNTLGNPFCKVFCIFNKGIQIIFLVLYVILSNVR